MEYKVLEEYEIGLLEKFSDDENTKYEEKNIKKFMENSNNLAFVAKDEDKIIGFAYGYVENKPDGNKMFYLYSIDILKEYQGNGYGTELIRYIKEYAKLIGCYKLYLNTNKSNIHACKCYEKNGFNINSDDDIVYVCKF